MYSCIKKKIPPNSKIQCQPRRNKKLKRQPKKKRETSNPMKTPSNDRQKEIEKRFDEMVPEVSDGEEDSSENLSSTQQILCKEAS